MPYLPEAQTMSFARQILKILQNNAQKLIDHGFDPEARIADLEELNARSAKDEAKQDAARVALLKATEVSNKSRKDFYQLASATVALFEGILGKNDALVHELHKIRGAMSRPAARGKRTAKKDGEIENE